MVFKTGFFLSKVCSKFVRSLIYFDKSVGNSVLISKENQSNSWLIYDKRYLVNKSTGDEEMSELNSMTSLVPNLSDREMMPSYSHSHYDVFCRMSMKRDSKMSKSAKDNFGLNKRLMIDLVVHRSGKPKKAIHVFSLTIDAIVGEGAIFPNNLYCPINGTKASIQCFLSGAHFAVTNLLGMDALCKFKLCIHIDDDLSSFKLVQKHAQNGVNSKAMCSASEAKAKQCAADKRWSKQQSRKGTAAAAAERARAAGTARIEKQKRLREDEHRELTEEKEQQEKDARFIDELFAMRPITLASLRQVDRGDGPKRLVRLDPLVKKSSHHKPIQQQVTSFPCAGE
uniref:Uncharacterized protein n=1 Tax=Ditylenchus dipsaci TaxID=166011 RepID=A0A915DVE0_9BILA